MARLPLLRPALGATLTLVLLPAAASAHTRYASPTATATSGDCPAAMPCKIGYAVNGATPGDEAVVTPGSYATPAQDTLVVESGLAEDLEVRRRRGQGADRRHHHGAARQRHTDVGGDLLAGSRSPVVRLGEVIARTHHEHWDGSGYPAGLAGDEIPLAGRITAICDVFDALVTARPYKPAWAVEDALDEIRALSGKQFDPGLVELFFGLVANQSAPEMVQ